LPYFCNDRRHCTPHRVIQVNFFWPQSRGGGDRPPRPSRGSAAAPNISDLRPSACVCVCITVCLRVYVCRHIRPTVLANGLYAAAVKPNQRDSPDRTQLGQNNVSAHHFSRTPQRGLPKVIKTRLTRRQTTTKSKFLNKLTFQ